ncbi:MAG: FecR family protein [Bacteroidetes bacterium]|nr:FecR family protein [Bacteroidota bacterium]
MRKIDENLEISQLLLLYLKDELSESDKKKVDNLLKEDQDLKVLFLNLQKTEFLDMQFKRHRSINLEEKWLVQKVKMQRDKFRKKIFFYSRVAAAVLIPILTATYLLLNYERPFTDTKSEFIAKVIPESSKTQLIVEKGQIYEFGENEVVNVADSSIKIEVKGRSLIYADAEKIENNQQVEEIHTLIVPRGGEFALNLSDGSKIWVNSETTIKYPKQFLGKNRVVELVSGEAYFEIALNSEHPFVVNTEKGMVQVLGTSFNIRSYTDEETNLTTLIKGSVSLRHKFDSESTVKLNPGQQGVIIDVNRKISVKNVDTSPYIAWKDGYYIFNSNSLESIFNQLSRWYDFKVEFENDYVMNMKFRGNVDRKAGITQILDLLEKTQKVSFEYSGKTIRVKSI